jgi:hypothetical protein
MISGSLFFYQNWLTFLLALWLSFLLTKALANDKNVDAMISEIKDINKVYVMFNYDGMLVSIYADQNALTEEFWNSFSLKKV